MLNNLFKIPEMISLSELRYKTGKLREKIQHEGEPVLLMDHAKKLAVLLPITLYEELVGKKSEASYLKKLRLKTYPLGIRTDETRRIKIYAEYLKRKIV